MKALKDFLDSTKYYQEHMSVYLDTLKLLSAKIICCWIKKLALFAQPGLSLRTHDIMKVASTLVLLRNLFLEEKAFYYYLTLLFDGTLV